MRQTRFVDQPYLQDDANAIACTSKPKRFTSNSSTVDKRVPIIDCGRSAEKLSPTFSYLPIIGMYIFP